MKNQREKFRANGCTIRTKKTKQEKLKILQDWDKNQAVASSSKMEKNIENKQKNFLTGFDLTFCLLTW